MAREGPCEEVALNQDLQFGKEPRWWAGWGGGEHWGTSEGTRSTEDLSWTFRTHLVSANGHCEWAEELRRGDDRRTKGMWSVGAADTDPVL